MADDEVRPDPIVSHLLIWPMVPILDRKNSTVIIAFEESRFATLHPGADIVSLDRVGNDKEALFSRAFPDYSTADLHYHDWEPTLPGTLRLTLPLDGRAKAGVEPDGPNARQFFDVHHTRAGVSQGASASCFPSCHP